MNEEGVERDLRRLHLLVMRAASDCGTWHPELRELDDALRREHVEMSRLLPLLTLLEHERPVDEGSCECAVIRHDIAAELRELLTGH